jgi:hypothetical protein
MGIFFVVFVWVPFCLLLWIPVSKLLFRAFFRTVTGTSWDGK